jgi:hypothetical protein
MLIHKGIFPLRKKAARQANCVGRGISRSMFRIAAALANSFCG